MEAESVINIWATVREYIPAKVLQGAADHLVMNLIDQGVDDEFLIELGSTDKYMKQAISGHVEIEDDQYYEWED